MALYGPLESPKKGATHFFTKPLNHYQALFMSALGLVESSDNSPNCGVEDARSANASHSS